MASSSDALPAAAAPTIHHDWTGPAPLRMATIAAFVPAFPLCVAHGALSGSVLPAVGLVPLAASAGVGVVLLLVARKPAAAADDDDDDGGAKGDKARLLTEDHPVVVFVCDVALAASLTAVLVVTWARAAAGDIGFAMLAAYATLPFIVNALIHTYLSLRAVYLGLALDHVSQWAAFQAVPAECPNCRTHLRPAFPVLPWFAAAPPRRRAAGYSQLFVDPDSNGRYHDDPEDAGGAGPAEIATPAETEVVAGADVPEPVEVAKKKGKAVTPAEDETPWDS